MYYQLRHQSDETAPRLAILNHAAMISTMAGNALRKEALS